MLDRRIAGVLAFGALVLTAACSAGAKLGPPQHEAESQPSNGDDADSDREGSRGDITTTTGSAGSTPHGPSTSGTAGSASIASCDAKLPYKTPGCPCKPGEKAACWTGPREKRNIGACHDGEQVCNDDVEFPLWGPCAGEVLECGDLPDAGQPEECGCVPGASALCDEDCEAGIFCLPFSTRECLPSGKWGPCRERATPTNDPAAIAAATNFLTAAVNAATAKLVAANGVPAVTVPQIFSGPIACGSVYHGCGSAFPPETWVGDCSKHFVCGHSPDGPQ